MKKHGFLYTSSPVEKVGKIPSPQDNYQIVFRGPEGSGIYENLCGTGTMEKKLSELILISNIYGWRQLHFAVLDYFFEKYHLNLSKVHHEHELVEKPLPYNSFHVFRTFLYGDWGPPTPRRVPKSEAIKK